MSDKGRATERRRILAAATRRRAARIEERQVLLGISSRDRKPIDHAQARAGRST